MFPETSGTAALSGRDLPPAAALAADKHLTALAQALKAAGTPGTLDTLRARAYLHLLCRPARRHPHPADRQPRPPRPRPTPRHRSTRQRLTRSAVPAPAPAPAASPGCAARST